MSGGLAGDKVCTGFAADGGSDFAVAVAIAAGRADEVCRQELITEPIEQ